MEFEKLAGETKAFIAELFRGNAGGHDAEHSMRVYHNAMLLADGIPDCDREEIALAALLHDADDHKLFHTENNANARGFLSHNGVPEEKIDLICAAINSVSFSRNRGKKPETIEGQVVQDADRLDALGAVGVARTFAYGGEHGRPLDDSLNHFREKLLLLKDEMNTPVARALAEERHDFLLRFLEQYEKETKE